MESMAATERLAALAHASRLDVFRRLVQRGPQGLAAGEIASALGVAPPTLSFHLAHLVRAGLVRSRRAGRSILYSADYDAIRELVGFLYENCCGSSECAPVRPPARKRAPRSTA
jgi:ArsR family transcriptional regulator, arsenate/arsenite/antimonite-responsive transcriptional repressor